MILYFQNGSKQHKKMIESTFVEDIYDTVLAFFEEKNYFPHFLRLEKKDEYMAICFESQTECFLVSDMEDADTDELEVLLSDYIKM